MEAIDTIVGKLLFITYQMYKENEIDTRGKLLLKGID
jgi:hypothetical protein